MGICFLLGALLVAPSTFKKDLFSLKELVANFDSRKQSWTLIGGMLITLGTYLG